MDYEQLSEEDAIALRVAIGHELVKLFNLKMPKNGLLETATGKKSMQGIGSTVIGILETQYKRIAK